MARSRTGVFFIRATITTKAARHLEMNAPIYLTLNRLLNLKPLFMTKQHGNSHNIGNPTDPNKHRALLKRIVAEGRILRRINPESSLLPLLEDCYRALSHESLCLESTHFYHRMEQTYRELLAQYQRP